MPRMLRNEEIAEILALKPKDITKTLFVEYFADTKNGPSRFNTNDTFVLEKGMFENKETITTTIGRYIFNLFVYPKSYIAYYGYQNQVIDGKGLGKIDNDVANAFLNKIISWNEYNTFLKNGEWLLFISASILSPSIGSNDIIPIKEVMLKKEELMNEYREQIESGDLNAMTAVTNGVSQAAKEAFKKDPEKRPGLQFMDAGLWKMDAHYLLTSGVIGPIEKPGSDGKKFYFAEGNYTDTVKKKEYALFSNLGVNGAYQKGVGSAAGGYLGKKTLNSTANLQVDHDTLDCGTKNHLEIFFDASIAGDFMYMYVLDGSDYVMLNQENYKKYVGKNVKLRFPMFCLNEKLCRRCAGEYYTKIGMDNIGMISANIGGNLVNAAMKSFHDSSIKISEIDIEKYLHEIK